MTRPTKIEVNCTTGVQTVVELTDEEMQEQARLEVLRQNEIEIKEAEEEAKAAAKASAEAKLTALGLTPEEIAALR